MACPQTPPGCRSRNNGGAGPCPAPPFQNGGTLFVRREQVPGAAGWAKVALEEQPVTPHQVGLEESGSRMPGSASDTYIAPGRRLHLFANMAEVKGPAISAGSCVEHAVEEPRSVTQPNDTTPTPVSYAPETPGRLSREVITVQIFEGRIKVARCGQLESGGLGDAGRELVS